MRISARVPRVIASLLTIVLLLATVTFTAGWYQPSPVTATGEKTSNFLPSDTTAYFSFNLLPGQTQSDQFTFFLSFYKDAILEKISESSTWGSDYLNDNNIADKVGPELALATYDENSSSGLVFFVQIPATQPYPEDVRDLVILSMDASLGGEQSRTELGGGIIQVNRSMGSELKTEYYVNTSGYVIGAVGSISLSDFETLNNAVASGAWTGHTLGSSANFKDVQNNLPSDRMGIGFMNKTNLKSNAVNMSGAVQPYMTALEGKVPVISTIKASLDYLTSPIYDDLKPYVPAYAGASMSGVSRGLQVDFYSPDDSYPGAHGTTNSLATAELIPSTALSYATDINANAWWQTLFPMIKAHPGDWESLFDTLNSAGLNKSIDVNLPLVHDFALQTGIDANTFNWSSGAFAWSHLPYASNQGQLLVFDVSNYAVALTKIGIITNALNTSGITGVEYRFVNENTSLLLGWPAGVITDSQLGPRLQSDAFYQSMRTSYLFSPVRGLAYTHAAAPLQDTGAAYYIGSTKGRLVFRMPAAPEQLFDIKMTLASSLLEKSADLTVRIRFESFGTVPTPVDLTFMVLDERGHEVYHTLDSITVETEYNYVKKFPNLKLTAGDYVLVARTLYNVDVSDEFRQDFSVEASAFPWYYIVAAIAAAGVLAIASVYMLRNNRRGKARLSRNVKKRK